MEVLHEWVDDRGYKRRIARYPNGAEFISDAVGTNWINVAGVNGLLDSIKGYTNTVNPSQPQIIETEAGTFLIQDGNVYKWDGVRWVLTERDDLIFDTPDTP